MSTLVGPAVGATLADRVTRERDGAVRLARAAGGGVVGASAGLVAAAAVGALGDGRWLGAPAAAPTLCWVLLGTVGALGAAAVERRVRRVAGRDAVVRHVERERALRAGALRVALEVGGTGAMGAFAAAQLAPTLATTATALAPEWRRTLARQAAGGTLALVAALGTLAASAAHWADGAAALAHPIDAAHGTLLPALQFVGAPARIARGRPLQLTIDAPGRRALQLTWRSAGHGWRTRALAPDARGRAVLALAAVDADLAVVASDGRAHTDTLRVRVDDRAFIGGLQLRAIFPAYLGLTDADVPLGDTVRVPRGTTLALSARASAPLARATLVENLAATGGTPRGVSHDVGRVGDTLSVRWTPAATARIAWSAAARDGGPVDLPEPFAVVALPDAVPVATVVAQGAAYDGATPVTLAITAGDDHGLAAVRLHVVRRATEGAERPAMAPVPLLAGAGVTASPVWSGSATVDPTRLGLAPGESIVVRVQAVDASPWAQQGWSTPLVLSVPTVDALRGSARATGDSALAGVAAALAAARDLQQRTADAARSRAFGGASPSSSASGSQSAERAAAERAAAGQQSAGAATSGAPLPYEAAERARALAAQQRQLSASVAAARAQTEALTRRLQQAGALDTALARQLSDAQRMLREALTPELAAKLAAMEQGGGSGMSAAQTRATLEQLAEAQRALRERLERTADLLRRAALEGAMQTLGDEARDVAAAEARAMSPAAAAPKTAGTASRTGADPAAGESPARTAARAAAVRDAIDSLRARLGREQANAGAKGAAEANAHAARSAQAMQRAAQGGAPQNSTRGNAAQTGGRPQTAGQNGAPRDPQAGGQAGAERGEQGSAQAAQDAAAEMRAAADALAHGRSAQIDQWKAALGAELDRAASETAQLAREQAAVREAARSGGDPAGARSAEAAVREGVEQTARRLAEAGRTSALLSERTRRAMDEARQQVGAAARALERQGGSSAGDTPGGNTPGRTSPSGTSPGGSAPGGSAPGGSSGAGRGADAAMADAQDALARAAGALVRDRARVRDASSATGAEDVLAQFRAAAGQQGQLNAQSLSLPQPGKSGSGAQGQRGGDGQRTPGQSGQGQTGQGQGGRGQQGQGTGPGSAQRLAAQQREIADRLEQLGDADASGRAEELAREARALAAALDRPAATNDPATLARQQQLYRKLLEAGQSLERDDQDDKGPREARAAVTVGGAAPADGPLRGRSATRVTPPTWSELRALDPEERRLVLEYFRRLNAAP